MGAHQPLPHLLLLLLLLVSVLVTKRASSSTTLSCFSVGLLDLPTFGFNQEEGKAEEKSEVTIIVEIGGENCDTTTTGGGRRTSGDELF